MIYVLQIALVLFVAVGAASVIIVLSRQFRLRKIFYAPLLLPVVLFSLGFILRLAEKPVVIDLGFFLTEFSSLLVFLLIGIAMLLGQIKYWRA